ncbi:MAG: transporter substrate-binding domain-containing protein [Pseudomonadota bacterium]
MKVFITLFAALAIMTSSVLADNRKLKIAATDYPPFYGPFYGEDLDQQGLMTETIGEGFQRADCEFEISFFLWKRALEGTEEGKHNSLFTVWSRPERAKWFGFSDPLPANELVFFKHKKADFSFGSYDDLKPYKVGVVRGYAAPPGSQKISMTIILRQGT